MHLYQLHKSLYWCLHFITTRIILASFTCLSLRSYSTSETFGSHYPPHLLNVQVQYACIEVSELSAYALLGTFLSTWECTVLMWISFAVRLTEATHSQKNSSQHLSFPPYSMRLFYTFVIELNSLVTVCNSYWETLTS